MNFLPSVFWINFYTVPLLLEYEFFNPGTHNIHLFGAIFILVCLFAGDFLATRGPKQTPEPSHRALPYVLLGLALTISTLHIILADFSLPFLADVDNKSRLRHSFYKEIPLMFIYISNLALNILYISALGLFFLRRKFGWTAFVIFISIGYALWGGAKHPVIMFIWISGMIVIANTKLPRFRFPTLISLIITGSLCLGLLAVEKKWQLLHNVDVSQQEILGMAGTAEMFRKEGKMHIIADDLTVLLSSMTDYLFYRIYFVPVEVSNNWYWYYLNDHRGIVPWINRLQKNEQSLSREIGANIYAKNHLRRYHPNRVNANASVDADAFARFGIVGILIVGFMIFVIRIASLVTRESEMAWIAKFITLGLLSLGLHQSSIQAILVAQGAVILIVIQTGLNPSATLRRFRARIASY